MAFQTSASRDLSRATYISYKRGMSLKDMLVKAKLYRSTECKQNHEIRRSRVRPVNNFYSSAIKLVQLNATFKSNAEHFNSNRLKLVLDSAHVSATCKPGFI